MSDTAPTGLALYVIEERAHTSAGNLRRLVRLDFDGGRLIGRADLLEREQQLFSHLGGGKLHGGRLLYTPGGAAVDLATGAVMVEPAGTVLGIEGGRLVVLREGFNGGAFVRRYFSVCLDTFSVEDLLDPGAWALEGRRSPDGARSAVATITEGLTLHAIGEAPRRLLDGLTMDLSDLSSAAGAWPPCLWLDEHRILTQRRNGLLVVVPLDGEPGPEIDLRLTEQERLPIMPPRLWRDLAGEIVYRCHTTFRVRPDDREWGRYEQMPLGHGFAVDEAGDGGRLAVRWRGEVIGKLPTGRNADTCPGHLALSVRHGDGSRIGSDLHVWSEGKGWRRIDLTLNSIVGWVDQREG